jgi:hypothetical protein
LLKPQEARGLRLKAEGDWYREICRITGWTYTKVNRVITKGRRALRRNALAIAPGGECERLAPTLAEVGIRAADVDELRAVDGHLRGCLRCRARLKALRSRRSAHDDAAGHGGEPAAA